MLAPPNQVSDKTQSKTVINKLQTIISTIIDNVNSLETFPSDDNYDFSTLISKRSNDISGIKLILFPPNYDSLDKTMDEGYKRYKPSVDGQQSNDGHNGLKALIYGILFKNAKYIDDGTINNIIEILYRSDCIEPVFKNTSNAKNQQNKSNFKYGNINTQIYTGKRHILDILNTIMGLIDESFNYGYSYMGIQYGKKGSSTSVDVDLPNPNEDTLGYLIYIVAFYNIRWLDSDEIPQYKDQFAQALKNCDASNNTNRCKDPSLKTQIKHLNEILAPQKIDSSPYIPPNFRSINVQ